MLKGSLGERLLSNNKEINFQIPILIYGKARTGALNASSIEKRVSHPTLAIRKAFYIAGHLNHAWAR